MQIVKEIDVQNWHTSFSSDISVEAVNAIEQGKILLLPQLSFSLLPHERAFLSAQYSTATHKNISFNSATGLLGGTNCTQESYNNLRGMLQRYAENTTKLLKNLLSHYANVLQIGRTSFRPVEIYGRKPKSYRKDDTRLHVDAFPATPNQGKRILRIFTNINPHGQFRHWRIGEPFGEVAAQFLPTTRRSWPGRSAILKALKITKGHSTEYDYTMLQIHNQMKADLTYQKSAQQCDLYFPPGCSWIVQTDHVSHAALSGQYVLEQTFYLPVNAMLDPNLSPLKTLERLVGRKLA